MPHEDTTFFPFFFLIRKALKNICKANLIVYCFLAHFRQLVLVSVIA